MNPLQNQARHSGFTLIELIIVIGILSFVAVAGIRSYGNLRDVQARKMNAANIRRVQHALATYEAIHREQGTSGFFNNFDSLVDVSEDGLWTGSAGDMDWGTYTASGRSGYWDARQVNGTLGIYDGSWKNLRALYNAAGQGSGAIPSLAEAQAENLGTRNTGLFKILGIYYLTADDAALLQNAGINQVLMHNPSTAQSSAWCNKFDSNGYTPEGLQKVGGGGPGFRPDMSAFYPVPVTNGLPVAIINPTSAAYSDLGYTVTVTNSASSDDLTSAVSGQTTKLIAFGIGLNAECVRSKIGLGEAPYDPVFDKKNYRSYIAVFALTTRGQGTPSTCHLAGVIDASGNTSRAAEYQINWTTSLD